jgi:hypothetical protein
MINHDSMPSSLDSCPGMSLLLVVCMTLPVGYSIFPNTAKKATFRRERNSPELKKKAKR